MIKQGRTARAQTGRLGEPPRGDNGERLCRNCKGPVPPPKLTFCSQWCVDFWKFQGNPYDQRAWVKRRDDGVCALCGFGCEQAERFLGLLGMPAEDMRSLAPLLAVSIADAHEVRAWLCAGLIAAGFNPQRHFWEADHIVPVVEGGGLCDLSNFRTLCIPCHKRVTRELAQRRAAQRRAEKRRGQAALDLRPARTNAGFGLATKQPAGTAAMAEQTEQNGDKPM